MYFEEYVRENKIIPKTEKEEKRELVLSIIKAKMDLDLAIKNYEFAEGELIDYYLYQIKAQQSKLDYLIKAAKDQKIMLSIIDKIKYDVG